MKIDKRGEIAFRSSNDKIVEWADKLGELELDLSKEEVHSPVSFSRLFQKDETGPSFITEAAYLIGGKEDSVALYFSEIYRVANLSGVPATSYLVGLTQQELPLGIQIMGNFFHES